MMAVRTMIARPQSPTPLANSSSTWVRNPTNQSHKPMLRTSSDPSLGDGVIASLMAGIAPENPRQGKPTTSEYPVTAKRLYGVLRTGWRIDARRGEHGRDDSLVRSHHKDESPSCQPWLVFPRVTHAPTRLTSLPSARATSVDVAVRVALVEKRITSYPCSGRPTSKAAARKTRLHRLRHTALPTRFGATNATRERAPSATGMTQSRTSA